MKKGENNPNVVDLNSTLVIDISTSGIVIIKGKVSSLVLDFKEVSILRNTLTRWMNKNRRNNAKAE